MIDLIAGEYGWTISEILDGHTLDELRLLARYIGTRRREERLFEMCALAMEPQEIKRELEKTWRRFAFALSGEREAAPLMEPGFFE